MKPRILEATLEHRVVRHAEYEMCITSTKLNVRGRRGQTDRVFWIPGGRPLLLELKREGEEPRKLQLYTIKQLRELGYNVETADNFDAAIFHIRSACAAARLDSSRLSKKVRTILDQAVRSGTVLRSRTRQNKHRS